MLTGITNTEIEKAPRFDSIRKEIKEMLEGCVFVAHNARFDYGFIRKEFGLSGESFRSTQLCTAKMSRRLFPEFRNHNLDSLIERYDLACPRRHRALDDALVSVKFYQKVSKIFSKEQLLETINQLTKRPALPGKISQEEIDELPECPGVYIFYGEGGSPLYVGKSKNIKQRVLSHFQANHESVTEFKLSSQVERIEAIKTAGELGASLFELKKIAQLMPIYNQRSRVLQKMITILITLDRNGYKRLVVDNSGRLEVESLAETVGVFKSTKQAKEYLANICEVYGLCDVLTGLEHSRHACFGYQLGRCKGACVGKESPAEYNRRLDEAIAAKKIRPWVFDGAIEIVEKDAIDGIEEAFIFDRWSWIGYAKSNGFDPEINTFNPVFDWEVYKEVRKYLAETRNLKRVRKVSSRGVSSLLETA